MLRVILHAAILGGIALTAAQSAYASDIACETSVRSSPVRCEDPAASSSPECPSNGSVKPQGQRLICEYAMLSNGYERIYEEQQEFLRQGKISNAEIAAWRGKRDNCDSVACLDGVFAEWDQRANPRNASPAAPATFSGTPSGQLKTPETESLPVRRVDVSPSGQLPATKEAQPEGPTVGLEIRPTPEPGTADTTRTEQPAAEPTAKKESNPLAGLIWIGIVGIVLAQALMPKRDRRFTTGYKNNRTIPTAVPILYGLSAVAILVGFIAS